MIRSKRKMQGFTLIELMISLVIGATITSTGLTLYLQMSKGRGLIQAELALQENSYYIAQTLKQLVNQAGYRPVSTALVDASALPVSTSDQAFAEDAGIWEQGEFLSVQSDGLAIRFEGASDSAGDADGSIIDCQGTPIAEGGISEMVFSVTDNTLLCLSGGETTELIVEADGVQVEQLALYWGIDTNNDDNVDEYVLAANDVTTSDSLLAVRIKLLLSSRDEVTTSEDVYTFDEVEYDAPDSRLRREMITTVQIKN